MDSIEYLKERKRVLEVERQSTSERLNRIVGAIMEIEYAVEQLSTPTLPDLYIVDSAGKEALAAGKGKDVKTDD